VKFKNSKMVSESSFYQKEVKWLGTKKIKFKYKIIENFRLEETSGGYLIQSPVRRTSNLIRLPIACSLTQNWEEWLIHRKAVLPFSVTWTGWKVGQRGT